MMMSSENDKSSLLNYFKILKRELQSNIEENLKLEKNNNKKSNLINGENSEKLKLFMNNINDLSSLNFEIDQLLNYNIDNKSNENVDEIHNLKNSINEQIKKSLKNFGTSPFNHNEKTLKQYEHLVKKLESLKCEKNEYNDEKLNVDLMKNMSNLNLNDKISNDKDLKIIEIQKLSNKTDISLLMNQKYNNFHYNSSNDNSNNPNKHIFVHSKTDNRYFLILSVEMNNRNDVNLGEIYLVIDIFNCETMTNFNMNQLFSESISNVNHVNIDNSEYVTSSLSSSKKQFENFKIKTKDMNENYWNSLSKGIINKIDFNDENNDEISNKNNLIFDSLPELLLNYHIWEEMKKTLNTKKNYYQLIKQSISDAIRKTLIVGNKNSELLSSKATNNKDLNSKTILTNNDKITYILKENYEEIYTILMNSLFKNFNNFNIWYNFNEYYKSNDYINRIQSLYFIYTFRFVTHNIKLKENYNFNQITSNKRNENKIQLKNSSENIFNKIKYHQSNEKLHRSIHNNEKSIDLILEQNYSLGSCIKFYNTDTSKGLIPSISLLLSNNHITNKLFFQVLYQDCIKEIIEFCYAEFVESVNLLKKDIELIELLDNYKKQLLLSQNDNGNYGDNFDELNEKLKKLYKNAKILNDKILDNLDVMVYLNVSIKNKNKQLNYELRISRL
jgi:hypothetical protein